MIQRPPEKTLADDLLRVMLGHSINDITSEQMNRIIRRLNSMSREERDAPITVGQVLCDELGEEKALKYIETALANGQIKRREYDQLRAVIILRMPRDKIPPPWAAQAARELIEGHKLLKKDLDRLRELGLDSLAKAGSKLDEDIKRILRSWGL